MEVETPKATESPRVPSKPHEESPGGEGRPKRVTETSSEAIWMGVNDSATIGDIYLFFCWGGGGG